MNRTQCALISAAVVCLSGYLVAQVVKPASKKEAYYVDQKTLAMWFILPDPPAENSPITAAEIAEDHRLEKVRTAAEIAAAQADDKEEDIFSYRNVVGPGFTSEALPLTTSLSTHVHNDESAVGGELKLLFHRPRPYQADATLHPVCALTTEKNSYPSGHSLSGYLLGFTLVELIPEKRQQILERADNYAHNRMVCGVHYASDVEASRRVAYAAFANMLTNPKFQKDLAAAREELQKAHLAQQQTAALSK